jgi:SAM-dependent methyltransferase
MATNKNTTPDPRDLNASCAGYDQFAWLFNEQWGDFAVRIFPALAKMVEGKMSPEAKILDLCCGTGQLARLLTEKGYQVTGLDVCAMLSPGKRSGGGVHPRGRPAFSFSPFCGGILTWDSLNHLLRDLQAAFRNVFDCLLREVFCFDLNTQAYRNNGRLSDEENRNTCMNQAIIMFGTAQVLLIARFRRAEKTGSAQMSLYQNHPVTGVNHCFDWGSRKSADRS